MREKIREYLKKKGWKYTESSGSDWFRLDRCPVCEKSARKPFAIHAVEGTARCFHGDCGWSGGLTLLQKKFGDKVTSYSGATGVRDQSFVCPPIDEMHNNRVNLLGSPGVMDAFCSYRCLTRETLVKFNIGLDTKGRGISYPYLERDKLVAIKYKKRKKESDGSWGKLVQRWVPTDSKGNVVKGKTTRPTLFGLQFLKGNDLVIVVEGEDDCMVLTQLGYTNVVSIPNGSSALRGEWLDAIEDFHDVIICFDNDSAGRAAADELAGSIGRFKCRIASLPSGVEVSGKEWTNEPYQAKDITDFIRAGREDIVRQAIDEAPVQKHDKVVPAQDFLEQFKSEFLYGSRSAGVSTGFPSIDAMIGGRRTSEVTLITGLTAAGKTSFVLNLILNAIRTGEGVLFGTFEIPIMGVFQRLAQMVTRKQYFERGAAIDNPMDIEDVDMFADIMDALPLYFINVFGEMDTNDFIDCVDYSKRRLGCNMIVLDHLHFMIQAERQRDQTIEMEKATKKIKLAAINTDTHIYVVAHPKKVDGDDIGLNDIKGASSASQDVDNFWVVRRDRENDSLDLKLNRACIEILKNRELGTEGIVNLGFDKASKRFIDPLGEENLDNTAVSLSTSYEGEEKTIEDDEFEKL